MNIANKPNQNDDLVTTTEVSLTSWIRIVMIN